MTKLMDMPSAWAEKWPAPAKLNLMLRITGQRDDGYHLLQTVFQMLDLCDWIQFYQTDDDKINLKNPIAGVAEETDLTMRAAKLLQAESGCKQGVYIEVEKNLPMGGGLGGGSSDAATTLLVLNKLWNINFSQEKLMQMGLQLGADVPVFIYGFSAWAEGVGEELEKIELSEKWVVVIKPDCHVDTKEIFLQKDLTRNSKSITMTDFLMGQQQNDCIAVVRKLYSSVEQALLALDKFSQARLTGTGACIFAQFDSQESAYRAYNALKPKWQVYLSKGMNESLLSQKLALF